MPLPVPFVSSPLVVEDQWIDYNGHFNMAYYNVLFDRAADQTFEAVGLGPAYVKATNCSFFTLETHTTYLRELHAADTVLVETVFLDSDHKRVHYVQRMLHAAEGWESCILEVIIAHVDMVAKRTSNFPDEIAAKISNIVNAHTALMVPKQVGHKIGIPRK
jgi:acyl-CoA thioester hydrolase